MPQRDPAADRHAFAFIILMGVVSLFGDMTYESARSITGPYLASLGATAAIVGTAAGLGEFAGYVLRLVSGWLSDRFRRYWSATIVGYLLMLSIPLLAFAHTWEAALFLIIAERVGKAVRSPARDVLLSHAARRIGSGTAFGIHEAMDQAGAIIGPLIFSAVFLFRGGYRTGFSLLLIPALLALAVLFAARLQFPDTERFEPLPSAPSRHAAREGRLTRTFWLYTGFVALSVLGFANFALISYHMKLVPSVPDVRIPLFYAAAMATDALTALMVGRWYDRAGLKVLAIIPVLTAAVPLLAFSAGTRTILAGILLWGVVMGTHETIMRAAIADLVPPERRGSAYGVFNAVYGVAWLLAGAAMGVLYERAPSHIAVFTAAAELCSLPLLLLLRKETA